MLREIPNSISLSYTIEILDLGEIHPRLESSF